MNKSKRETQEPTESAASQTDNDPMEALRRLVRLFARQEALDFVQNGGNHEDGGRQ